MSRRRSLVPLWWAPLSCALLMLACGPPTTKAATVGLKVVPTALDPIPWLATPAAAARAAGALELEPIGASVLSAGDQLGSFIELEPGLCLLALARAGSSVRDVDLFVYSDSGDSLVADETASARAATMLCPPRPRRVYVAARVVAGHGMVALGVMAVPEAASDAVAEAVEARGLAGTSSGKLAAWPGLERRIHDRRTSLGARWEDIRRVALPLNPRAHAAVSVPIEAGRCLDVLVTPGEDLLSIDATLVDGRGKLVGRSKTPGRDRAFVICSQSDETITVLVRSRQSTGLAAVIVARSQPGAAAELVERIWLDAVTPIVDQDTAVARHSERLKALGLGEPRAQGEVSVAVGAPASLVLKREAGCSRFEVVGGAPLGHFAVELWSEAGLLLDSGRGGEHVSLFACGEANRVRLEATAIERAGGLALLSLHDPSPPTVASRHPLAAARLLGRLNASSDSALPRHLERAEALEVAAGRRVTRQLEVPARGCLEVLVAVEGDGEGVVLRLTAGKTLLRSRGRWTAADRVCAGASAQPLTAELSLDVGSGTAVWLQRPVPE